MEHANMIDGALARIDGARWGSAKKDVVLAVKLDTVTNPHAGDGVPVGYRHVAKFTGLEPRYVHRILRELVDEHVLIARVPAAGNRGVVYAINLDVRAWQVPWRVAVDVVAIHGAVLSGALRVAKPPFVPRWGAAQTDLVPRSVAAQFGASAALGRGANGHRAPRWGAAQTRDTAHPSPFSTTEGLSLERDDAYARVEAAIVGRTGAAVFGACRATLLELVQAPVDVDELVRFVERHPNPQAMPPLLVAELELEVTRLTRVEPAGFPPSTESTRLPGRVDPPPWLVEQTERLDGLADAAVGEYEPGEGTLAARAAAMSNNGRNDQGGDQ